METLFATLAGAAPAGLYGREHREALAAQVEAALHVQCVGGTFNDAYVKLYLDETMAAVGDDATQLAIEWDTLFAIDEEDGLARLWIPLTQAELNKWHEIMRRQGKIYEKQFCAA